MRFLTIVLVITLVVAVGGSFLGIQPLAGYKDNVVTWINQINGNTPNGTYSARVWWTQASYTFSGNSVRIAINSMGTHTYTYRLLNNNTTIELTDIITGKIETHSFKYIKDFNSVAIDGTEYTK